MVSLFDDGLTPTQSDPDASLRTVGNDLEISDPGYEAFQGRVWIGASGILPADAAIYEIWDADGPTLLHSQDMAGLGPLTANEWSPWFDLDTPVALDPAATYWIGQHVEGGVPGYYFTDGVPAVFPLVSGVLTSTTGVFQNGGPPGTPLTSTYGAYFFADVNVRAASASYEQTVGGTITPAGATHRGTARALAANLTPSAGLTANIARALAGSLTPSGAAARNTAKALAGSLGPSGSIGRLVAKALAGQISPAGVALKLLSRALGGTVTPSGSVAASDGSFESTGARVTSSRQAARITSNRPPGRIGG